jgi:hypothetical protein
VLLFEGKIEMNRRAFLASLAAAASPARAANEPLPPVRAITKGPLFHWFGYYDKLQFDPSSRYALGVSNDFQHRLPTADDGLKLGMVDLEDGDNWIELGETKCWSWHQTCMIQWLPGSKEEIIWNDRQGTNMISHILNVRTRQKRTLPKAIYCVSPDARWALVNDFARSFSMRPETGYAGGIDPYANELAPAQSGIWRMDLKTGDHELILSLADLVKIPLRQGDWSGLKHYIDHLLIAPGGRRFAFLQRWGKGVGTGFATRMCTADAQGKNLRVIDDSGESSHYNWRDPETLLLWTRHPSHGALWYLINERTVEFEPLDAEVMNHNGHISYLPGGHWILSDTAPDRERKQHEYLYDTRTRRKVELGGFYSPPEFKGYWRCDTTPRGSPDGRKIIFDSPHGGKGRQMYLIDISGIVA